MHRKMYQNVQCTKLTCSRQDDLVILNYHVLAGFGMMNFLSLIYSFMKLQPEKILHGEVYVLF